MTNIIQSQPYPPPNPAPLPLEPESLATELALLGSRRLIEIICDLDQRLTRLERSAPVTASPATPARPPEVVEDLGNGWQIIRTQ